MAEGQPLRKWAMNYQLHNYLPASRNVSEALEIVKAASEAKHLAMSCQSPEKLSIRLRI